MKRHYEEIGRTGVEGHASLTRTIRRVLLFAVCILLLFATLFPVSYAVGSLDLASLPAVSMVGASVNRRRNGREPDSDDPAGSYSRYSSTLQSEKSNADQQRECREMAARKGHQISSELEFSDEAVSGTTRHRVGLDALLAAAEAGRIRVLYFHSLSRLSRESVITLPLLKHLVFNCGVRIISCSEGVDSADTGWELIAHIMSIVHEQFLRDLAANVMRGQEGTVLAGLCVGDCCFGYTSEPIPGSEQGRRGRNAKPRKMYVIDPLTAAWVARIFHWFVNEGRSLRWITRELNRLGAPKDHRSTTAEWHHAYVAKLLRNRKYVGDWSWGKKRNVRDPLTGLIRQEDRSPQESEQWRRHFPHLRLIDNKTFVKARRRLKKNQTAFGAAVRKERGKFSGMNSAAANHFARHLLQGLIQCAECGSKLYVGGADGKYLCCPGYAKGNCTCKTHLRRGLATQMILDQIGLQILSDPDWRKLVLDEARAAWEASEAHLPTDLSAAERALAEADRAIKHLVDRVENGMDIPEIAQRLAERRAEKRDWSERADQLRAANQTRAPAPTEEWIDEQLRHLGDSLRETNPAAAEALMALVGGTIVVTEIRKPGRERHHWQGRFTISASSIVRSLLNRGDEDVHVATSEPTSKVIVIDFREPRQYELECEDAKELWDKGWLMLDIAKEMNKHKSYVTKLIKHWFESRQLKAPDGRGRRSTLEKKHRVPPMFEALADSVESLLDEGLLIQEIAEQLGCCHETVTKVIEFLRAKRGLSIPDGRTRRKSLDRKVSDSSRLDSGINGDSTVA